MDENMENQTPTPDNPPQQAPQPPQPAEPAPVGDVSKDDKMWGMFCHLAALVGYLPVLPFPIGNVLGPLILWLIKKDEMPFVDDQGKEALNFQISVSIYTVVCLPLICLAGLGAILAGVLAIANLVFIIIASITANKGQAYRYPCCIRLVK